MNRSGASLVWVSSWVTSVGLCRFKGAVILGRGGEGPIIFCKNVLIGHLGTPISPSGGRQNLKVVLEGFKGVVDVLLLLGEKSNCHTKFIIVMINLASKSLISV